MNMKKRNKIVPETAINEKSNEIRVFSIQIDTVKRGIVNLNGYIKNFSVVNK